MRTYLRLATVVACIGAIAVSVSIISANAQAPRTAAPARPAGLTIAVIDIALIYKKHTRFKQATEDIKQDVSAFDALMRNEGKKVVQMRDQLREYTAGSPEYKQLEETMARTASDLRLKAEMKRKEFLEAEAKVYHNVYREIANEVAYFAERHGIDMVLRFNSEQVDPSSRASILQGVNRAVIYQKDLNITYDILDRLEAREVRRPADPSRQIPARPGTH